MDTTSTTAPDPMAHARELHAAAKAAERDAIAATDAIRRTRDEQGHADDSQEVTAARTAARAAWAAWEAAREAEKVERDRVYRTPVLGGPATIQYVSDSYPAVVTAMTATTVTVRMVAHGENESDPGTWLVSAAGLLDQPQGGPRTFSLRKTGRWVAVGSDAHDGTTVRFGTARYFRDYAD